MRSVRLVFMVGLVGMFLGGCKSGRSTRAIALVSADEHNIGGFGLPAAPLEENRRISFHYIARLQGECEGIRFYWDLDKGNLVNTRTRFKSAFDAVSSARGCDCVATIDAGNHRIRHDNANDCPNSSGPELTVSLGDGAKNSTIINGLTIKESGAALGFQGIETTGAYNMSSGQSVTLVIDFGLEKCVQPFFVTLSNGMTGASAAAAIESAFEDVNRSRCGVTAVRSGNVVTFGAIDVIPELRFQLENEHQVTIDGMELTGQP